MFPVFKEYSEKHPHHLFFLGLAIFSSSALYLTEHYELYPQMAYVVAPTEHVVKKSVSSQMFPAVVTEINGSKIEVNRSLVLIPSSAETSSKTEQKTLIVSSETKTTKFIEKDPQQYAEESKQYADRLKNTLTGSTQVARVPSKFIEVPATKEDLQVGKNIFVMTSEDPKTLQNLTATVINIFPVDFVEFFGIKGPELHNAPHAGG